MSATETRPWEHLLGRLREIIHTDDPRSIDEMIAEDEHHDWVLDKVEPPTEPGGYWFAQADGVGTGFKMPEGRELKVGDTVRLYGPEFGTRHGFAVNGELIEWKTPWERLADDVAYAAAADREDRERFDADHQRLDAIYEGLPAPLKRRIDRFRAEDPTFRMRSEAYEMAAVGDAPKIARALAAQHGWDLTADLKATAVEDDEIERAIRAFWDLDYAEQRRLVPDLDDGHSGNTFGGACSLAAGLLYGHEL
jgi:hypothetical protein